jgi:transcriptional regulator with XRE-family HTH domain
MNVRFSSSAEMFAAAARAIADRLPYGSQKTIAKAMGVRDGYLSDLLKGKRNWSDNLRDKFAHAVGMSVVEIYGIGEGINKTGKFFPYSAQVADTPPSSPERASRIVCLTMQELRFDFTQFATPHIIAASDFKVVKEYLAGRVSDEKLYDFYRSSFIKGLENYTLRK